MQECSAVPLTRAFERDKMAISVQMAAKDLVDELSFSEEDLYHNWLQDQKYTLTHTGVMMEHDSEDRTGNI